MNKLFTIWIGLSLIGCTAKEEDSKTQLADLKKQEAELRSKIATLEAELNASDTSLNGAMVAVVNLIPESFRNYIEVQARVDAEENISLSTEIPGTITRINVKPGDEVKTGQVLAETDARAIMQQMSDLETNASLVNQVYEKQKNLWDQKIGTEIQFLQAKTNKESMEKKLSALREQHRMSKIISPINGTVDAVDVKLGQAVAPGMPAIRVINFSKLKVKAEVAESYASRIRKGSEVIVYFPDLQDSIISKVNFVSRAINSSSRTFTVEVPLKEDKYHPNMVARLSINDYQSEKPVIVIPVRTIQKDENNEAFVFVAESGIARKRIISTGKEYRGHTEVKSGLNANDSLVILGYDLINDGDVIRYRN